MNDFKKFERPTYERKQEEAVGKPEQPKPIGGNPEIPTYLRVLYAKREDFNSVDAQELLDEFGKHRELYREVPEEIMVTLLEIATEKRSGLSQEDGERIATFVESRFSENKE